MDSAGDLYDISILYTKDTIQWCEYLFDIFKDYDIQQNSEDITEFPFDQPSSLQNMKNSMLNVVIISPMFLQMCKLRMQDHLHHVVGILCGVDSADIDDLFNLMPSTKNWTMVDATAGCNMILQVVLKALANASKNLATVEDTYLEMTSFQGTQEQGDYVVMKGKMECDGQLENTYFTHEGPPEENYEAMKPITQPVESYAPPAGHVFQSVQGYVDMKQAKHLSLCSQGMTVQPAECRSGESGTLFIIFQDSLVSMKPQDLYSVSFQGRLRKSDVPAKQRNPFTLEVELPKDHPAELTDGQVLSPSRALMGSFKFLFKSSMDDLTEVLLNVTNPMQFMCQVLGISPADSNELDNVLYEHIQRCLPEGGLNLLVGQEGVEQNVILEVPTALHFAAFHGLKSICSMLISCPGAVQAMKMKNRQGLTPDAMAGKNGHSDLQSFLENFLDNAEDEGIQAEGSTTSYLCMKKGLATYYKNEEFLRQLKEKTPNYDLPFPVPIPAIGKTEDEMIKKLVQGKQEDIENFYDILTIDLGSFQRDQDAEEDYEEVLDEFGKSRRSNKRTISHRPPMKHPSEEKAEIPETVPTVETKAPVEVDTNKPETLYPMKGKMPLARTEVDAEQQALIDLQNSVKNNDITVDEAVLLFKNLELLQQSKSLSVGTRSEKKHARKPSGFKSLLPKKVPKKGHMPIATLQSKPPMRFSPSEITTGGNRPTSTTSSASLDSRGSVLSSDRDSSYCSSVDEPDPEKFQPVLRRQDKVPSHATSQVERLKRLSSVLDFSQDYIQKPVPAIPSRSPLTIPRSLQDLPKPVPPISSPEYPRYGVPPSPAVVEDDYLELDGSADDGRAPEDLPALPPPPVPGQERSTSFDRVSDQLSPMSPKHVVDLGDIQAVKQRLKPEIPQPLPRKPVPKPRPTPRT